MSKKLDKKSIEVFKIGLEMTKALEKKGIIKDFDHETAKELDEWVKTL